MLETRLCGRTCCAVFRLYLTCDNSGFGCTAVVKLDMLTSHIQVVRDIVIQLYTNSLTLDVCSCYFYDHVLFLFRNVSLILKSLSIANKVVGLWYPRMNWKYASVYFFLVQISLNSVYVQKHICGQISYTLVSLASHFQFFCCCFCQEHNCVRELRSLVQQQQSKITDLQTDSAELKLQMNEVKREVQLLKVRTSLTIINSSLFKLQCLWMLCTVSSIFSSGIYPSNASGQSQGARATDRNGERRSC